MHQTDNDLFLKEMSDVKPLTQGTTRTVNTGKRELTPGQDARRRAAAEELTDPNPLSTELRKRLDPYDFLFWKESGVQEGVWKKLRLGKYQIEANLDLHLFAARQARHELHNFLTDCYENGIRSVLIRHGRGEQGKEKATIKSFTSQWLREHDLILAFHSAQKQHGGTAAVYAMLKKNAEARANNREAFARRSQR